MDFGFLVNKVKDFMSSPIVDFNKTIFNKLLIAIHKKTAHSVRIDFLVGKMNVSLSFHKIKMSKLKHIQSQPPTNFQNMFHNYN